MRPCVCVHLAALSAAVLLPACRTELPATNPWDTETPARLQAKGALSGEIVLAEAGMTAAGVEAGLLDAAGKAVADGDGRQRRTTVQALPGDGEDAGHGSFRFAEVAPGTYRLSLALDPRFVVPALGSVVVRPGEEATFGVIRIERADVGSGRVRGEVRLSGGSGGPRVVQLHRRTGRGLEAFRERLTEADGSFSIPEVPPGTYALSATLEGFTPDFRTGFTVAEAPQGLVPEVVFDGANALVLHDATAVLVPLVQQSHGRWYTRETSLPLAVLAFGAMNEMRLSTSASFRDEEGSDVGYEEYAATAAVALPDAEGDLAVYAQFRRASDPSFPFTSPVFSTALVRDASAPAVLSLTASGPRTGADGVARVGTDAATIGLSLSGSDRYSAVASYAVAVADDAPAPGTLTFASVDAPGGVVSISRSLTLPAGEGARTIHAYLRDRAGNTSAVASLPLVVDTTDPVLQPVVAGGGGNPQFVSRPDVVVVVNASDASPLESVRLSSTPGVFSGPRLAYLPLVAWQLAAPETDGPKEVAVEVVDAAGRTGTGVATIRLDSHAPRIGLSVAAAWSRTAQAAAVLTVSDEGTPPALLQMQLSLDAAFAGAPWVAWQEDVSFDLGGEDGPRTLYARVRDAAGNTATTGAALGLDSHAPVVSAAECASCRDHGGIAYAAATPVRVALRATDATSGLSSWTWSLDGGAASAPLAGGENATVDLDAATDEQIVAVVATDVAGNAAEPRLLRLVLDTQDPVVVARLADGATHTADTSVRLDLDASSDRGSPIVEMRAGAGTPEALPWLAFQASSLVALPEPAQDGPKVLHVAVRDAAGRTSELPDLPIVLDRSAPAAPDVTVGDGSGYSGSTDVALSVASDDPDAGTLVVEVAGDLAAGGGRYALAAVPDELTLAPGEGARAVSVTLVDAAGNRGQAALRIVNVDLTDPVVPPPLVGAGTGWVRSADGIATVVVDCADAGSGVAAESWKVDGGAWTTPPLADSYLVPLGGQPREFTLTARCRDRAGRTAQSAPTAAVWDPTPPSIVATILGNPVTPQRTLVLSVATTADPVAPMTGAAARESSFDCRTATYEAPVDGTISLEVADDGFKRPWVCVEDRAGNRSGSPQQTANTVEVDTVPPAAARLVLGAGENGQQLSGSTDLAVRVVGGETGCKVELSGDLAAGAGTFAPGALPPSVTLRNPNGVNVVTARLVDGAGNASPPFSAIVTVDRTPPAAPAVLLHGGAARTSSQEITVLVTGTAADTMRFWEATDCAGSSVACGASAVPPWVPFAPSSTFLLSAGTGAKRVCWKLCDAAGNGTAPAGGSIVLDTYWQRPAPVLSSLSPSSVVAFSQASFTVTLGGSYIAAGCSSADHDTKAIVGDYTLPCTASPAGDGSCGRNGALPATGCATACTVTLPDNVARNSGTYPVRLRTPAPAAGDGTSATTLLLNVVAPVPKIVKLSPRGIVQAVVAGAPAAGPVTVDLWGAGLVDNTQFHFGGAVATVAANEDLGGGARHVTLQLPTAGLWPADDPVPVVAVSPAPGGGEAEAPFGLNPVLDECPGGVSACQSVLGPTRAQLPGAAGVFQGYGFLAAPMSPVGFLGASFAEQRTPDGATLLTRAAADLGPLALSFGTPAVRLVAGPEALGNPVTLFPAARRGDGSFAVTSAIMDNDPRALAVGDVDGNGWLDVALVRPNANTVTFLMNSNGTLSAGASYVMGTGVSWGALGDLDDDGRLDLVTASLGGNLLSIRFGTGAGTFGPRLDRPLPGTLGPTALALADTDNNGALDIVTLHSGPSPHLFGVQVRRGDGLGGFAGPTSTALTAGTPTLLDVMALGDLDGDQVPDLVAEYETGRIAIRYGDGTGLFTSPLQLTLTGTPTVKALAIADLNGDGAADLVVPHGDMGDRKVTILLNAATGDRATLFSTSGSTDVDTNVGGEAGNALSTGVVIRDFDGDGRRDLAIPRWNDDRLVMLAGRGDGTFAPPAAVNVGPMGVLVAADFDRDGSPDLLGTNSGLSTLHRLSGGGTAATGSRARMALSTTGGHGPTDVQAVDMNRDGRLDVLAALSHGGVSVALGRVPAAGSLFQAASYYAGSNYEMAVRALDLDLNGWPDVVATHQYNGYLAWAPGTGAGALGGHTSVYIGAYPMGLATADFNGDGRPDVASATNLANTPMRLTILPWQSTASPYTAASAVTLTRARRVPSSGDGAEHIVAAADLDLDGRPDLAVIGETQGWPTTSAVEVFRNLGTDGWAAGQLVEVLPPGLCQGTWCGMALAVGDVNDDGIPDLAVGSSTGTVAVRKGASTPGTIAFGAAASTWSFGSHVSDLQLADLDGDGELDLLASDFKSGVVAGRLGDGRGGFGRLWTEPAGSGPRGLAAADFDGDGAVDYVVANNTSDDATVRQAEPVQAFEQRLWDMPPATLAIPAGSSEFGAGAGGVSQAAQHVDKLGVHLRISGAGLESLAVVLKSPRGDSVVLEAPGCGRSLASATLLDASYPTSTGCESLAPLLGWQGDGVWSLQVTNTGAANAAQLVDFAVVTHGSLRRATRRGTSAAAPELVALRAGATGRVLHGTTLGYADTANLTCASTGSTSGDAGGDGLRDAGDHWYEFVPPAGSSSVDAAVVANFDAVLAVRAGACAFGGAQLGCDDDGFAGKNPKISGLAVSPGSTYCLVVDGVFDGAASPRRASNGDYDLYLALH